MLVESFANAVVLPENHGALKDCDNRYKDCKWWKDKDGVYRKGTSAESKCLINRREVMEGMGYCYMFEPQESEG